MNKSQVNESRCRKKTELQTFSCSFVKKIDQNETQYRISRGQSSITRAAAEKHLKRVKNETVSLVKFVVLVELKKLVFPCVIIARHSELGVT